jgi:hypothetical protein
MSDRLANQIPEAEAFKELREKSVVVEDPWESVD